MITEKDFDTSTMFLSLKEAIQVAAEGGEYKAISFQKFIDDETGNELWDFSFTEQRGNQKLPLLVSLGVLRLFQDCDSVKLEELLCHELANLIESQWNEKNTIQIETSYFQDEYDMYGVSRSCFY